MKEVSNMTYKTWRTIERSFSNINDILVVTKDIDDKGFRNKNIDEVRELLRRFVIQLQEEIDDAWN